MTTEQNISIGRLRVSVLVWFGQLVSLIGSSLTSFVLAIWVYQDTDSITQLSLISFCTVFPTIAISPLAGTLVDRWDKRRVMIFSDIGVGAITLIIALLFLSNQIEIWHVYFATLISSTFSTFQRIAYSAAIPLIIPRQFLGRANGMVQLAYSVSPTFAPALAGILLVTIGIQGVMLIDFITFVFAITTLTLLEIPEVETGEATGLRENIWSSTLHGLNYLVARPGLLGLLLLFTVGNFLLSVINVIEIPLILSIVNSTAILGMVMSIRHYRK